MKKVFSVLTIYTIIIFLCCLGETFIYRTTPVLIPGTATTFRIMRALNWFLTLLPTIFLSGFTVACAVLWKSNTSNSRTRFSAAMVERYKTVIISALVFVALLSFNAEIFRPLVSARLRSLENAPIDLKNDLQNAGRFMQEREYEIAYMYALRASKTAPSDEEATAMLKRTHDALDIWHAQSIANENLRRLSEENMPLTTKDHSYSVKELVERSRKAAEEKSWFNSHYWANLAVEACRGVDTNIEDAQYLSVAAWNELKEPKSFEDTEEFKFYRQKWRGYMAFTQGDFLDAYYVLNSLNESLTKKHKTDPDVDYYLARAKENLENEYFFIDETNNIEELSTGRNVYFSLKNPDGSHSAYYIRNVMNSSSSNSAVLYLKDLTITLYSASGRFIRSAYIPLAKAVSYSTADKEVFTDEVKKSLGINKKWKEVPFLMLTAVDRSTQGKASSPVYSDKETSLPPQIMEDAGLTAGTDSSNSLAGLEPLYLKSGNTMILPMEFRDFASIDRASAGAETMSLFSLIHFIPNAQEYGYAKESFLQTLLGRSLYPLFLLILFIIMASTGWNYRIAGAKVLFRTSWLFVIIIFGVFMFFGTEIAFYIYKVANYVFVAMFKDSALFIATVVYIVLFIMASMHFMSRKR